MKFFLHVIFTFGQSLENFITLFSLLLTPLMIKLRKGASRTATTTESYFSNSIILATLVKYIKVIMFRDKSLAKLSSNAAELIVFKLEMSENFTEFSYMES